ncbi:MAG: hypothetical protein JSR63_07925 [Proteobacteria bacterium]|nr:hypothetical protein [Pseudomonadota bacterium]
MSTVDRPLNFRMEAYPVDREVIFELPTFNKAMDLTLSLCDFENDKDAARKLQIDPGLFSKRRTGQAPWQVNDVDRVMQFRQTLLPVAWWAHRYGHGLVMLETEAERRERGMREELAQANDKIKYLESLVTGKAGA